MNSSNHILIATAMSLFVFGPLPAIAEEQKSKPYVGSEPFERMKQLVGTWEGEMDMGKGPVKVRTNYKLTSNGSALVETVFEGQPHEMVTVYHDDSHHQMTMTHYCMLNNQPKMSLIATEDDTLSFDLSKDADIDVAHEPHMHAAAIMFKGKDQIIQQWTKFEGGNSKQVVEVAYSRIK